MSYLIDTHVALWVLSGEPISAKAKEILDDIKMNEFELLGVEESHIELLEGLEYHHRDPFDRLLIASAMAEDMTFISADENIPKYAVKCLW